MTKMFDLDHCGQCGEETDELYCSFLCEECKKKDRADAALGRAVRAACGTFGLAGMALWFRIGADLVGEALHISQGAADKFNAIAAALEAENENV